MKNLQTLHIPLKEKKINYVQGVLQRTNLIHKKNKDEKTRG